MASSNEIVDKLIADLEAFVKGSSKANPMAVIAKGMEVLDKVQGLSGADKKVLLVSALRKIAAGKDGVAGTEDDVFPPEIVEGVRVILEKDLVSNLIDLIVSVTKGEYDINQIVHVAEDVADVGRTCWGGCQKLFAKLKTRLFKAKAA